jgi:heme-degrading monooxygenase HmoA
MIEVNKTFTFHPNVDQKALTEYRKKAIGTLLQTPGVIEVRSQRNILGTPQVRLTILWQTLADWANFAESNKRFTYDDELRTFASDIRLEIWGPSPSVPEPLHSRKC